MTAIIDIQNATVFQQSTKALESFSLMVEGGEKVAILGPNGAGKSTLLKLINRELYPVVKDESHVKLFGSERMTLWDLRAKLGFVSNDLQEDYTPYTRAIDVVASGFVGAIGTFEHLNLSDSQRTAAKAMLEAVDMTDKADTMLQRLSTGQKRRLLMARALIHAPKALILDEPSSGLDMGGSATLLNWLRDFCQPDNTLMIATHHVDEIIPEIERVVMIKDGKIMADGAKKETLTAANLSALYNIELEVADHNGWYRCWYK